MNKPLVDNYKTAENIIEGLTERIRGLNHENAMLKKRIEGLKDSNANLRSARRIAEAGRLPVLYLCDGGACGHDCNANGCRHTTNIQYAKNFHKVGDEQYFEVEPYADVSKIAEIVEEILEIVKRLEG